MPNSSALDPGDAFAAERRDLFLQPGRQCERCAELGDVHYVLPGGMAIVEPVHLIHPNHVRLRPTPRYANKDDSVAVAQTDLADFERNPWLHRVAEEVFDSLLLLVNIDPFPSWNRDRHAACRGDANEKIAADRIGE